MHVIDCDVSTEIPQQAPADRSILRSIHVGVEGGSKDPMPGVDAQPMMGLRHRRVNRSPDEEFVARMEEHGAPEKFPQDVVALMLNKSTNVEITKQGIVFKYLKMRYRFWSPTSPTCANRVGSRVLVTFDPDDMTFCHVLTPDCRHQESIPQYEKAPWFDNAAMKQAQKDKKQALQRDLQHFAEIHGPTSEQKAARVVSNAEKMQIVNTFPAPELSKADAAPAAPMANERGGRFEKAEELHGVMETLRHQKATNRIRTDRLAKFKPADLTDTVEEVEDMVTEEAAAPERFSVEALLGR